MASELAGDSGERIVSGASGALLPVVHPSECGVACVAERHHPAEFRSGGVHASAYVIAQRSRLRLLAPLRLHSRPQVTSAYTNGPVVGTMVKWNMVVSLAVVLLASAVPWASAGRGEIAPTTPAGIPFGDSYVAESCPAPVPHDGRQWSQSDWDEWKNGWERASLNPCRRATRVTEQHAASRV
jgi:hypothetical protein